MYYKNNKMNIDEIIKSINNICLFVEIFIFLVIKFLKYLLSREQFKFKKSESVFNSGGRSPQSI